MASDAPSSTRLYDAYIDSLLDGGLERLFRSRPVLGRLLGQSTNQWSRATASLCRRFWRDYPLLKHAFGWAGDCRPARSRSFAPTSRTATTAGGRSRS